MLIDCDTCIARGSGCGDCVIGVLLRESGNPLDFDDTERQAVHVLAARGLVPPLRLLHQDSVHRRNTA